MGDLATQMTDELDPDTDAATEDRGDEIEDRGDEFAQPETDDGPDDIEGLEAVAGDDQPPSMIPKARFDEVNEERKWLREQLERSQPGGDSAAGEQEPEEEQPKPFDYDEAESQYMEAVYNGEKDEALRIRREVNQNIRAESQQSAQQSADEATTMREQQNALVTAASEVIQKYPALNSQDESGANNEAIAKTQFLRDAYIAQGHAPAEALRSAAGDVAAIFGFTDAMSGPSEQEQQRDIDSKRRNADAANRQPAQMPGVGARGHNIGDVDVDGMSDDEFNNLSEAAKSRLRGD